MPSTRIPPQNLVRVRLSFTLYTSKVMDLVYLVVYLDIISLFGGISEWFTMALFMGFPCWRGRIRWLRAPRYGERRYKWLNSRKVMDRIAVYGSTKGPNSNIYVPTRPLDTHECSTCQEAGSNVFLLSDYQVICVRCVLAFSDTTSVSSNVCSSSCCRVRKPFQFINNAPAFCRVKTKTYKSE